MNNEKLFNNKIAKGLTSLIKTILIKDSIV